ncbi:hypothetical protein D210916BOD24_29820 [Alteromonas sp. D210916BOD_24]|uniref:Lnb N-terminal periplasmic domain-containing protein n=1 Tax=Alteromonas sp. D210916BOD_24 TaxID=3157618 RepID=UPI00399CFC2F
MEGIRFFLVVSILFLSQNAISADAQHSIEATSKSHQWLSLLHYEKSFLGATESAIQTPDFFYSPTGNTDPLAELTATLNKFQQNPEQQCKFPARALFIEQNIQALPQVECNQFESFVSHIHAQSVSLIYASGYLGNPASMYGHVFLKFNNETQSHLLDNTYNYGARYPQNEHPIAYIVNGIFGGYEGYFANQKYHHQTLTYTENELRDLWEYTLALEPEQITLLLAHLWELEQVPMTYYFFKQNCAYQIAHLLSLVTGQSHLSSGKTWVMPFDIINTIEKSTPQLIRGIRFHPSRQEALYAKYSQLSKDERAVLENALKHPPSTPSLLLTLNDQQAKRVIDTAFDYFAYVEQKSSEHQAQMLANQKDVFVNARFMLPPGKSDFALLSPPPPHEAQDTTLVQMGFKYNDNYGTEATLRFRANYYDLLTLNSARIPFSELSTFDLTISVARDGDTHLANLDLLKITNLNTAKTGLPNDTGMAWKLSTGYRDMSLNHRSGALYVEGLIGKSITPTSNLALYGGGTSTLTSKNNLGGYIAVGAEIGGVANVAPHYALSFSIGHQRYINDPEQTRTYAKWEQRFLNHKQFDIRTLVKYDDGVEYSISLSHYF